MYADMPVYCADIDEELDNVEEADCSPAPPIQLEEIVNPYPINVRRKQPVDISEGLKLRIALITT